MFGYEYTNPSKDELDQRRYLLNLAGYLACTIPVVLLIIILTVRKINAAILQHDEPHITQINTKSSSSRPTGVQRILRSGHWILTTTYIPEYGPLYVQIIGLIYVIGLLYLIISPAGNDYMHLTKAFGHVAVSQLPFLYLLSVKTPSSPITLATGLTHERLNAVHRLVGRILHIFLACHAVLYVNFFLVKGILWKRMFDIDVQTGMSAFWTLNLTGIIALPIVRAKAYHRVFYRIHVIASALIVLAVWYHVPYTRVYVGAAGAIWVWSAISRHRDGNLGWASSSIVSSRGIGNDLLEVMAKLDHHTESRWLTEWIPGMHGYLNQNGLGPKTPFTIVDVKQTGGGQSIDVTMVVRNLRGPTTGLLGQMAKSEKTRPFTLEGPYGEASKYLADLRRDSGLTADTLIVAGGIGATYALPIYCSLLNTGRKDISGVKLIWIVKQASETEWATKTLQGLDTKIDVEVIVTQKATSAIDYHADSIKTADLDGLSIRSTERRPSMDAIVETYMKQRTDFFRPLNVLVCGPTGLSQSLRAAIGRKVFSHGIPVYWYEEQFGFGGS